MTRLTALFVPGACLLLGHVLLPSTAAAIHSGCTLPRWGRHHHSKARQGIECRGGGGDNCAKDPTADSVLTHMIAPIGEKEVQMMMACAVCALYGFLLKSFVPEEIGGSAAWMFELYACFGVAVLVSDRCADLLLAACRDMVLIKRMKMVSGALSFPLVVCGTYAGKIIGFNLARIAIILHLEEDKVRGLWEN